MIILKNKLNFPLHVCICLIFSLFVRWRFQYWYSCWDFDIVRVWSLIRFLQVCSPGGGRKLLTTRPDWMIPHPCGSWHHLYFAYKTPKDLFPTGTSILEGNFVKRWEFLKQEGNYYSKSRLAMLRREVKGLSTSQAGWGYYKQRKGPRAGVVYP